MTDLGLELIHVQLLKSHNGLVGVVDLFSEGPKILIKATNFGLMISGKPFAFVAIFDFINLGLVGRDFGDHPQP